MNYKQLVVALFVGTIQAKNDFALLDNNVTVAALKNLVTDHPAPITLKLA
jgi:hypothetical protein